MIVVNPSDMFDAIVLGVLVLVTAGTLAVFAIQERARRAGKKSR